MELTLLASKTDQLRQRIQLIIAECHNLAYPVRAMNQFNARDTHCPPQGPCFCVGRIAQQLFTQEYVVQKLQTIGVSSGLGVASWNGHSFHQGAATWTAEGEIHEAQIQILRGGRSAAYKAYIDYSEEQQIRLSEHFQRIQPRHRP